MIKIFIILSPEINSIASFNKMYNGT